MFAATSSSGKATTGRVAGFVGAMMLAAAQVPAATATPDITVRYADLDLTTATGAEQLYERIHRAALEVCPSVSFMEVQRHAAAERCLNEVVAHAVNSIASPRLAAVYAAHTHHGAA